ncbi:hypothetical protein ACGFNX_33110 [Streptomyces sp. NPDC048723]|uniref:hypothetical protein n=1 Tax=Streptomyces sp. NPDC048723 TaxID=3365589 RepID=UPI00371AA41F
MVQDAVDPARTVKELAPYHPYGVLPGQETGDIRFGGAHAETISALDTVHPAVPRRAPGDRMRPTTDLLSSPLRVFLTGDSPERLLADHRRVRLLADDVFRLAPN